MTSAARPASGDSTAEITADGARPKPAASGDQPHTSTKNDGNSTSQPNAEPVNSTCEVTATEKLRMRNSLRSSSGCGCRAERMKKIGSRIAAPTKQAIVFGLSHPHG